MKNRQIWLRSRPNGIPQAADFDLREVELPTLADGEFLVHSSYLSADPAMRGWIADKSTYWPRIEWATPCGHLLLMRSLNRAIPPMLSAIRSWAYSVGRIIPQSSNPK